jgi:RNA polymerase sigma factor (sigma-70 family)
MTPHALIAPARLAGAPLLRAQSDERLVDLVRAGNDAAFEAIVARYRKPLLRYCTRFMSEPRAEDVVQQAMVSAYASLRSSEGEMSLRPWLYRIAHNTALNALRDRALSHEELPEALAALPRPDHLAESGERFRDVMEAVAALPERQRDAIVLRELDGRSYEEIAAELGVTGGAVRQLLNRGRNTLRSGMAAITPFWLLARVPLGANNGNGSEAVATRVVELAGAGAGATVLSKVAATALVTGAVIGGVAGSPEGGLEDGGARGDRQGAAAGAGPGVRAASVADDRSGADEEPVLDTRDDRSGHGGRREGDREDREDNSGPGSGDDREDRDEDHSGRGRGRSGGDEPDTDVDAEDDSSGPGSGEEPEPLEALEESIDNSGSGSGSSGSGSSGSGSSGSGSSGSGSSSGSSGSGSSGSGSG